jgi:hypothetical protein
LAESRNNTEGVGLNKGLSGIGKEIDKTRSRVNYRSSLSMPDSKMIEIRTYVLQWISSS